MLITSYKEGVYDGDYGYRFELEKSVYFRSRRGVESGGPSEVLPKLDGAIFLRIHASPDWHGGLRGHTFNDVSKGRMSSPLTSMSFQRVKSALLCVIPGIFCRISLPV